MRRIALELAALLLVAAALGVLFARGIAPRPACAAVRAGAERLPVALFARTPPGDDDRRSVPLSTILGSVRATPRGQPRAGDVGAGPTRPRGASGTGPAITPPAETPSVYRDGSHVHIDLHGAEPGADLLAGASLVPQDAAAGGGYRVQSLDQAGLLAAAGIAVGDVLVAVDGSPTLTADQALVAFAFAQHAHSARLTMRRADRTFDVVADMVR
ncbi:MAG: hypothetical protein WCJ30_24000 [Deltaproteobacteria bacterium]